MKNPDVIGTNAPSVPHGFASRASGQLHASCVHRLLLTTLITLALLERRDMLAMF